MTRRIPFFASLLVLLAPSAFTQSAPIVTVLPPRFEEFRAVADPALIPARRGQTFPTVASNGENWLIAWSDTRYANVSDDARAEDVFATIVDATGRAIHPEGIPIAPTWASDRYPSAVWTGTSYLVAWSSPLGLLGAHLDAAGGFVRSGVLADPGQHQMHETAIARSGNRLLLVWSEDVPSSSRVVRYRVLGTQGNPLTAPADLAPRTFGAQRNPSVAAFGDGFLVAWEELSGFGSQVFGALVSPTGAISSVSAVGSGPNALAASGMWTSQASPSVASAGGTDAMIVWTDGSVRARDWGASGPGASVAISTEGIALAPRVIYTGQSYAVLWSAGTVAATGADGAPEISSLDLYSATVSNRPPSVSRRTKIGTAPEAQVDIAGAWNQGAADAFVAWTDFRLGGSTNHPHAARFTGDLFGGKLTSVTSGPDEDDTLLAFGPAEQRAVALATLNNVTRAVWTEEVDDDEIRIATHAFAENGDLVGEPATLARTKRFVGGDIAANARGFGIVWGTAEGVKATRIGLKGDLSAESVITSSFPVTAPAIASDRHDFLILWDALSPDHSALFGSILTAEGIVSTATKISNGMGGIPRVTWTGARYLVVWTEMTALYNSAAVARFVSNAGIPLGDGPTQLAGLFRIEPGPGSVASSGSENLVALGPRLLRTDAALTMTEVRDNPFAAHGEASLVWTGEAFALAIVDPVWAREPGLALEDVAVFRPRELVGLGERNIVPLPSAHTNTIGRVVLTRATINIERRRLTGR